MPKKTTKNDEVKLGTIEVARLVPYEKNSRVHTTAQVEQIAASIKEFGFLAPIVIDASDGIIAGHGRIQAAKLLGIEKVPFIRAESLTSAQRRAYLLVDNRLAETSFWDRNILQDELIDFGNLVPTLESMGFSAKDLDELHLLEMTTPDESASFTSYDEKISTNHACPKCGYSWNGPTDARNKTQQSHQTEKTQ